MVSTNQMSEVQESNITPNTVKICVFKVTRGYKKGQNCGIAIVSGKYEYCTEHRRVLANRTNALKRYADKWGVEQINSVS